MPNKHYDVVVIGAGIQGAGVAQAAAAFGYKTLLIEKYPQAGMGTSCKSSKLIHGGLRYLESGQFKLVRECLIERKRLLKNAPHLVKLTPFYIPVYKNSLRPAWLIRLGLIIYSLFSFKLFSVVNKKHWRELDDLKLKNLKMVFKYYDAQTDDKKLTQAVIKSAQKLGAEIIYDACFIKSFPPPTSKSTPRSITHLLSYEKNQRQHTTKCRCIINCSGPWVSQVQEKISPRLPVPDIELVAGTHIVIKRATKCGIYYIEASDKRAVFVMPWKDKSTLIGTTERVYTGDANDIQPTENEINYLLAAYNKNFNSPIKHADIIDSFAGLRVLPASQQSAFNKPRESLIIHNQTSPALVTIIGGKLTAYRASSENVLNRIIKQLGKPDSLNTEKTDPHRNPGDTKDILL